MKFIVAEDAINKAYLIYGDSEITKAIANVVMQCTEIKEEEIKHEQID